MDDTSAETKLILARMISSKTPAQRLRMASNMFDTARKLVEAGLRNENSSLTTAQLRAQLFLRLYKNDFTDDMLSAIMKNIPNMQSDPTNSSGL
jgi:hypothetical protein